MKNIACIEDLRALARRKVPKAFFEYADSGSYNEETLRANRAELEPIFMAMEDDWDREEAFTFAILDASSNVFLGTVGLNRINKLEKTANLHYWVRAGQTGRGIATRAAMLAARFGLTEKGFQRIGIIVPEGNWPSERVAERLGAQREGVMRNACRLHDRPVNATVYSLIPADLEGVLAA